MQLICAWCGSTIDRAGYGPTLDSSTSHGMCPTCSETIASEQRGVSLERHIDSIPIPILLVDRNNVVVTMNSKAGEMLGGKLATARQLLGHVFDCVHSRRPEGCGRTIRCSSCAIRRSVAATFSTGEPEIQIPATLTTESPDQLSEAVLTITTVKSDGVVLLRVEQRAAAMSNKQ